MSSLSLFVVDILGFGFVFGGGRLVVPVRPEEVDVSQPPAEAERCLSLHLWRMAGLMGGSNDDEGLAKDSNRSRIQETGGGISLVAMVPM